MWKIAVADTAEDHLTLLKDALKAYFQETHRVFSVTSYTDLTFLEKDMAQGEHLNSLPSFLLPYTRCSLASKYTSSS